MTSPREHASTGLDVDATERILAERRNEAVPVPAEELNKMRLRYAGAIGLLCELSVHLRPGGECDELRDCIVQAVEDWCALTGWTMKKTLHRIEVFPPRAQS